MLAGAHTRPCSCYSAVLVPVRARVPSRSCSLFARVIVGCSYPSMLLLVPDPESFSGLRKRKSHCAPSTRPEPALR